MLFFKGEKETFVYITNTKYDSTEAHMLYRKRWQIETNFREQNKFLFKTKTRNFDIRYLSFVMGGLLFNAWQLTRNESIYTMESYLFKKILMEELLKIWQGSSNK